MTENIQKASATESAGTSCGAVTLPSPVRLIVTVLASAFVAEVAIMVGLSLSPEMPEPIKWLVDSVMLGVLLLCPLWLFVYWPMRRVLSERTAAFARLGNSEKRHRALFDSSRDAIMTLEPPSWRFTSGNPATVRMFKAADEKDFIAHEPWALSPERQPDGRPSGEKAKEMIETAMREGSHFFEWTHARIGGEVFPATVLLTRMELEGMTFLQATVRDITAQKQAEAAIARSAEEWSATFDAMDSYVAIIDTDCRVVRANRAMLEAFQGQDVIGANCYALIHGTEHRPESCVSRKTFESGEITHAEVQEPHLGNRWFDVSAFPIRHLDGTVWEIVHVMRDITARKTAEATQAALEVELRHQQKMAAVGTLACGMGHEINNPIMGIINYAQLIKDRLQSKDESLEEFADEIGSEAERIAGIVRGLNAFSSRDTAPHLPMAISNLVESAVTATRAPLARDAITLEIDLPDSLPMIVCHHGQMERVVTSLIDNARDALNEKYPGYDENKKILITASTISVSGYRIADSRYRIADSGIRNPKSDADQAEGTPIRYPISDIRNQMIRLTIEDHGSGIPLDVREHIFEPFFTTKDISVGAGNVGKGLGLFVSYAVVQEHGGKLSVESEPGEWTRFYVELPISDIGYRMADGG